MIPPAPFLGSVISLQLTTVLLVSQAQSRGCIFLILLLTHYEVPRLLTHLAPLIRAQAILLTRFSFSFLQFILCFVTDLIKILP